MSNSMIVNRRDLDFLMYEVFDLERMFDTAFYEDYDRQTVGAILDSAQQLAEEKFLPCAAKLDANEPTYDGQNVTIIPEVAEALEAFRDAGFFGAPFDKEIGGQQMPIMVSNMVAGMFACANCGISGYPFLTVGAANLLNSFGSEEQKSVFLRPMVEGRWFGTMCLSEPQAGSSLSDIRTKAEPASDGSYRIVGSKMWISAGEHDLSENIVHMVLAKVPGGPAGVKGISLFIVPKYRVNEDGSLGEKNNIALAGLNHKMGQRGITNTLLNFGETGDCHGYLVGELHQGLFYMFQMMNEARVGVGQLAVMSGLAGYLHSLDYARNRPQGRHPQNRDPLSPPVMIIEHADIRRLLMAQKAYVEGAQCLISYCSLLIDRLKVDDSESERNKCALLLEILTPIAKSWPSEFCLEANKHAIQILGGYGYTRDYPVERFYRDNRLNPIHEGTHAIHGLDILDRKVRMADGEAFNLLMDEIEAFTARCGARPELGGHVAELLGAVDALRKATDAVLACEDRALGLANATLYLDAFGHLVIAWMWLMQADAALAGLGSSAGSDKNFYDGKLASFRYFFRYELPKLHHQLKLVSSLDDTFYNVTQDQYLS